MSAEFQLLNDTTLRFILSHVSDPETVAALKSIPELKEIAEECCYSRISSLAFSVHGRNADSDGNILTSEVGVDGTAMMVLSKDEALVFFLELQNKAKHLHSLKIVGHEGPVLPLTARLTFGAQTMEILRDLPATFLGESCSVKELAVNVNCLYVDADDVIWRPIVAIMEKCPKVEFLELQGIFFQTALAPPEDDQNLKLVFEGPNASHLKRVKWTSHGPIVELFVDFEDSTINFSCSATNIRNFLSLRQRSTAFGNIKNARITTDIVEDGEDHEQKNQFLELTETMENVSVELLVVLPPPHVTPQGPADLESILKLGYPKRMFEWMGGFLERARGLDLKETKLTVELTVSLRKGTENALEGLVDAYNGGMQHPFSGEEFPYEYDTSTLAHPISVEMIKDGQWIENLWVVRKENKVAVLNLQFQFVEEASNSLF